VSSTLQSSGKALKMAAAVVYEGVVGGGDLFQGMKLYILQRVPDRNRWKGLVEVRTAAIKL
jgi:hypothetical protein